MENEEQPNFNLGSSWDFSDEDVPNFDLGSSWQFSDEDMSGDEHPNFNLGSSWDISDELFSDHENLMQSDGENDMDAQEQDGYGRDQVSDRYVIEEIRNRNIPKFGVQGHDYLLRVNSLNRGLSYDEAVLILHNIIQGEL